MKRRIPQHFPLLWRLRAIHVVAAASVLFAIVGCGPSDPIEAARQQMIAGDLDGAIESIHELLAEDSENSELLFLYGQVLNATGQPGLAEWPLRKAMQDPVWFEPAAKLLARAEQAGGNFENAASIYSDILEVNPEAIDVRIQRANACALTPALLEEALAEVDRILELDPDQIGAFKPRILAYMGLNKVEEAAEALEELGVRIEEVEADINPLRGWHCATMAIFASDSGDIDLAAERWARCEEEFPTHPNVVAQSIDFHTKRGELERALEVAQVAFAEQSEESSGYPMVIAELLRGLGRPDEAETVLLDAANDPAISMVSQAATLLALTEHYKIVGNLDAAASTLERALNMTQSAIGPQHDLLFSLADLLIQNGEFDRALQLSAQMTVAAHRSLVRARVAHDRKEYAKALELYADSAQLWPENPYAPYHEARAAMSAGLIDRAFRSYLLSIRVDETATDARTRAARLLRAQGQLGSAIEMLGSTRAARSPDAELLMIELVAELRGPQIGMNAANQMSQHRPEFFGQAIAAAAAGASRAGKEQGLWKVMKPLLSMKFPPVNELPIVEAGVLYAPGEAELAEVKPALEAAAAGSPENAQVEEIEGIFLERTGAADEAASRYRAALEIEPERVSAMLRLAGLTAKSDPGGAMDLAKNALAVQGKSVAYFDPEILLKALAGWPSSPELTAVLESALELAPTSGELAYRLALEWEAADVKPERVARLAERAVRFEAGEDAKALRSRVGG